MARDGDDVQEAWYAVSSTQHPTPAHPVAADSKKRWATAGEFTSLLSTLT
jgi:hypothetical protein